MPTFNCAYILFFFILYINAFVSASMVDIDYSHVSNSSYSGSKFPKKYLSLESPNYTWSDFNFYANSITRILNYFGRKLNKTEVNTALGLYFMKGVLKRTLKDYGDKLNFYNKRKTLIKLINKAENIISYYNYMNKDYSWADLQFRITQLYKTDDEIVYAMHAFNEGKLNKWIHSSTHLNNYLEQMDEATLPRDIYAELAAHMDDENTFTIKISDECITRTAFNSVPPSAKQMRPCRPDPECNDAILSTPSYSYVLSHRLVIILMRNLIRRCYMVSEKKDSIHAELMCSHMYREAVYLARRGYFARDMFLEHVTLCGMYGYEEFYRRPWFNKVASWVDENGCMKENHNFHVNQTQAMIKDENDPKQVARLRKLRLLNSHNDCHTHPMVLLTVVLAHGIRHFTHHVKKYSFDALDNGR